MQLFQLTASRRGWRPDDWIEAVDTWYFNSQPHEEADGNIKKVGFRSGHFNSQPHEEADEAEARLRGRRNISTHSLTKRLTIDVVALRCTDVFQLTASRRGWRLGNRLGYFSILYFNSQPHEEADVTLNVTSALSSYFNSQPHEEADREHRKSHWSGKISTHSLTKRLTRNQKTYDPEKVFQLTASRRGWHA